MAVTGWFNIALLIAMIAIAPFDHRTVMGINLWIKPMKFAMSITIFGWTVAWLLQFLPRPQRAVSWGISGAMLAEIAGIALQAARGTTSHYNDSTPFNAIVFGVMGLGVVVNTILMVRLLWLFRRSVPMQRATLWGVRFGVVLFILASAQGIVMIRHEAHTVGAPDGGPGLALVNWSTRAGDLRIAHFAGLHALQILPLAGWLLERRWPRQAAVGVVVGLFVVWLAVFVLALLQAQAGRPMISM